MDKTALNMMVKFAGLALLVLITVFVIAVVTPRLAKLIEKYLPKKKKKGTEDSAEGGSNENESPPEGESPAVIDPSTYTVKGPYDAQLGKKKTEKEEEDKDGEK